MRMEDSDINVQEKQLIIELKNIVASARLYAYKSANIAQVVSNWMLGKRIFEQSKGSNERADYGKYIVRLIAEELTKEFGSGYSLTNIKNFIRFFQVFQNLEIGQSVADQLQLPACNIGQSVADQSAIPLYSNISWTHYECLLRVADDEARLWYLKEAAHEQWSVRTLRRNISTQYYHRLLQTTESKRSTVEDEMHEKTAALQDKTEFIKNPVIMEFLGFRRDSAYSESEMESAIITHLQQFIMEMGKGFAFVTRQQHVRTDMGDFYIDLVFYNYILKCFFLIDLKTGLISHQDVGQMDMYVRMYDELKHSEGDNPTIGLLLGSDTSQDMARYSVLNGSEQIFQAKYLTYLPSKETLKREIEMQKEIFRLQHEQDIKEDVQ